MWYFDLVIWNDTISSQQYQPDRYKNTEPEIGNDATPWPDGDIKLSFLNLKLQTILI